MKSTSSKSTRESGSKKTGSSSAKKSSSASRSNEGAAGSNSSGEESALRKLFVDMLKDIYWAEKYLVKSLPSMVKGATSAELGEALQDHLEVTQEQATRLEQVFVMIGEKASAKKCDGMEGLVEEAKKGLEETEKGTMTRDVAIIVAAQKVEHYEISAYGSLCTLCDVLGLDDAKNLLGQTLEEEKEADLTLTEIAEGFINQRAASEEE